MRFLALLRKKRNRVFLFLCGVLPLTGCIRQEQTWSFVLRRDGRVDLTIHQDQVRSSEKTPEARHKEERDWFRQLRRSATSEQEGLKRAQAGGIRRTIHRDQAPFSVTTQARLPSVESIGRLIDLKAPEGEVFVETPSPHRTRLVLKLTPPRTLPSPAPATAGTPEEFDTPRWFFAPEKGRIVESEFCLIAPDRGSCRLDILALDLAQKRSSSGSVQASVTWEQE
jgi:hypothetical protein